MAFKDVANSFPGDAVPAIAAPIIGGLPVLGVAGLGLGAVAVLGPVAPPPFLVSLELRRTVESTAVQPGFGLAPITLAPLDTAAAAPPVAFMFGTHSASFNAVAPPIAGTVEPFMLCPGDGAPVAIRWAVRHAAAGFTASLELYRATRRNMPFWFCTFANNGGVNLANTVAWIPGGGALPNHTYYGTTFNGNVTAPGAGITPDASGFFPGGWLDSESGPYKLVLTITGPGGVQHRRAWTYFQVPAHKFKLLRYVPSTEFGCFGLEFDPTKPDLKVITRAYYGYESAGGVVPAFLPGGMNRHAALYQRIFKEWGAHYAMRVGLNSHRPLVFVIAHANAAVPNIAAPVSSFGAVITPIVRAAQADFPVIFTNKVGGSGVFLSAQGHYLRLYVPSAFEETEDAGFRKGQIHQKRYGHCQVGHSKRPAFRARQHRF